MLDNYQYVNFYPVFRSINAPMLGEQSMYSFYAQNAPTTGNPLKLRHAVKRFRSLDSCQQRKWHRQYKQVSIHFSSCETGFISTHEWGKLGTPRKILTREFGCQIFFGLL